MRKLALIILDGWGIGEEKENNAIHVAHTPFFDYLWERYPHTQLQASGEYVGLPEGQIGGSEVGHMTIGAGRVIYQELVRINRSLSNPDSDEFVLKNPTFQSFLEKAKTRRTHLVGLTSDGGVHSHMDHLIALLRLMKDAQAVEPVIHFISDGRDTSPTSGVEYAQSLLSAIRKLDYGKVVTLSGRFYAMDRDKNMDRTERAVTTICKAESTSDKKSQLRAHWEQNLIHGFQAHYAAAVSDEFIEPLVLDPDYNGLQADDLFFFYNFRSDRMKQLISQINTMVATEDIYTMTQYDLTYLFPIIFAKHAQHQTFGELLSDKDLKQGRVAESEKFPHVTYFFNGGVEVVFDGEERRVIQSNKVTHDKMPEMKADEITKAVEELVMTEDPHFVLVNFANPDMVGHTGNFESVVAGVQKVDQDLKELCQFLAAHDYICVVTADHGNADIMFDLKTHELHTAHTLNPVPFIIYDTFDAKNRTLKLDQQEANGLHMIAGTMLQLMGIHDPELTFESLII